METKTTVLLGALGIAALFGLIFVASGMHSVDAGESAVVFHKDGSLSELKPGKFQFVMPVVNTVTVYDVRSQVDEASASAASRDLQQVDVKVTVQFHPDPSQITWIHQNIGGDYLGKVIQPAVQEAVKASTAQHDAATIIRDRPELKAEIEGVLQTRLDASHIIMDQVSLTDIQFSPEFSAAIEASQTAKQNIVLEQNRLVVARLQANQTIAQAEGQAESARLLANSTNGDQGAGYLFLQYLSHWDGHLPMYMTSDSSGFGFIMPTPQTQK